MVNNPLNNLKIEAWYHVFIILGTIFLGMSLMFEVKQVDNISVQLLSLGILFIGIGEWNNHPFKNDATDRLPCRLGKLFDLLGFLLCALGVYHVITL